MSGSMSSNESPARLVSPLQIFWFHRVKVAWTTANWRDARPPRKTSLSTPTRFSKPSTKPPDGSNAIVEPGDRPWRVKLHREVQRVIHTTSHTMICEAPDLIANG